MRDALTSFRTVILTIPESCDGITLEAYLKTKLSYSRRMLTRLKKNPSYVLKNGVHLNLPEKVYAGDRITLTIEEITYISPEIQHQSQAVPIVYEDDAVLLYNKPCGMPIHPSRNHQNDTLANIFTAEMSKRGTPLPFRVLNRLDRDTSGLCLCAKTAEAAHILSLQQQNGTLQKEYTAIVCGHLPPTGIIEAPIARLDDFRIDRVVREDGQYAKTAYWTETANEKYTLVRVKLYTGRTHQIRVHFSHIGHPLARRYDVHRRTGDRHRYFPPRAMLYPAFFPASGNSKTACFHN